MEFKFFNREPINDEETPEGILYSTILGLDSVRPYRARVLYPGGDLRTFYSEVVDCSYNQFMNIVNTNDNIVYQLYAVKSINDNEIFGLCDPSDLTVVPNFFIDNPNMVHRVEYIWFERV